MKRERIAEKMKEYSVRILYYDLGDFEDGFELENVGTGFIVKYLSSHQICPWTEKWKSCFFCKYFDTETWTCKYRPPVISLEEAMQYIPSYATDVIVDDENKEIVFIVEY